MTTRGRLFGQFNDADQWILEEMRKFRKKFRERNFRNHCNMLIISEINRRDGFVGTLYHPFLLFGDRNFVTNKN
jgi:hypothetical protein